MHAERLERKIYRSFPHFQARRRRDRDSRMYHACRMPLTTCSDALTAACNGAQIASYFTVKELEEARTKLV